MAPKPGLLLSLCRLNPTASPPTTLPTLAHWYETIHIPDVFTAASNSQSSQPVGPSLALRYKNNSPAAQWPLLVLYQLPDVELLHSGVLQKVPIKWDGWQGPGGKRRSVGAFAEFEVRAYERIQVFEGQVPRKGRGKCIITVAMEPAPGSDDDFDEWYRKQHLDMLSMIPTYHRSTRYRLISTPASTTTRPSSSSTSTSEQPTPIPRYLAIHEYESADVPAEQIKLVVGSEWSKRVIGAARAFERDQWEYLGEYGSLGAKL